MRVYDPRVGRFLSVDPLVHKYAYLTPFQFSSNSPILCVDVDGAEGDPFSIGRAVSQNREWEGEIRRKDPEHAEQIIYEANKEAFLTVGSMLTSGSGSLFTWFLRGVAAHGVYKLSSGLANKNDADVKDGVNSLAFVAVNKVVGYAFGKVVKYLEPKFTIFGTSELGKMGEEALARMYGTYKPTGEGIGVRTSFGIRYIDGIPVGETLESTPVFYEAKVGYQELSGNIAKQVEKDADLLANSRVEKIIWVFFKNPTTGKVGASPELLQALEAAGIKTEIGGKIPRDIVQKVINKKNVVPAVPTNSTSN